MHQIYQYANIKFSIQVVILNPIIFVSMMILSNLDLESFNNQKTSSC